ncbi:delta-12 fatty acid desaturase [Lentinula raphanica]|uniref:Delta-12 fatty acid desaturase n=1 Tax=Lentinula raphanica TaxID=153919 RepID=A0AA38PGD7_9AGAR|nr:delta-12 fatty acid desaturase [Lentinula raphanica]KAJ3842465.1 delta-12 fatty acid desaturase [Lentinula raphanica]KAJ3972461.1 delta-12 fatty acid desaturase [Lentinula raphanica]
MSYYSFLRDAPEYQLRMNTPFSPSKVSWNELHSALPKQLFKKSTMKGLSYVVRDIFLALMLYKLAWSLDTIAAILVKLMSVYPTRAWILEWGLWLLYFNVQGIFLTSLWCLAHEASHGCLSPYTWINDLVGFMLHTFLLVPYFSWKSTHLSHHASTVSVELDENYVPRTRSDFALAPEDIANASDYHEALQETPIYTALRLIAMQVLGLISYLLFNVKGSPRHPPGTNHFNPNASLFKPHERSGVVMSDIGLMLMVYILSSWTKQVGLGQFVRLYFIPYLITNHWIVMLTYLQHTDPTIPHYRRSQWTFVRGALASVDRPFLGWIGRVFFHNVSHNHISHHLFSSIPFYNQPIATEYIKKILKEDYNYDSTNSFRALYRSFVECAFIEDEGNIVFFKNRKGHANRVLAESST